jgi:hypothetical protein
MVREMSEKSYVAGVHYIVKALDGLQYPVDKADLVARYGDRVVRVGRDEERTIRELVEPIPGDRFETAASLHNGIVALLPTLAQGC